LPFNICLIGDHNHAALKTFAQEIEKRFQGVCVSVLANEVIGDIADEEFVKLTPEQRLSKQEGVLLKSDLNLVYSDVDATTTDLAALFADDCTSGGAQEKRQTLVIMETPDGAQEADNLNYHCISLYDGIRKKVSECLAEQSSTASGRRRSNVAR
jgi:hypothetical protein